MRPADAGSLPSSSAAERIIEREDRMRKRGYVFFAAAAVLVLLVFVLTGCGGNDEKEEAGIYLNGKLLTFAEEGETVLPFLSVEDGIDIEVVKSGEEEVCVNDVAIGDTAHLDITALKAGQTIDFKVTDGDKVEEHTLRLLPETFPEYTVEGEGKTEGDYYMTTYDLSDNYLMKLNNKGDLIFYMAVTKEDEEGNIVSTNALDFRKQYNSRGIARYTYMPYLGDVFADGDCGGINPGCVRVLDKNYELIDEVYYKDENGEDVMIDPHGFIWIDDGHYILTAYKREVINTPEELGAQDNKADLAVLYIEEIKDGKVLWEFCSKDYEKFLYQSNGIVLDECAEKCQDYMHFNSMYIDQDDNLVVSCRHLNSILKISREDGSLMWQLGGSDDEFGLTDEQLFSYQHSIIVNEDGSYMLFDNANDAVESGKAKYSSVARYKVDEDAKKVTEYERYNVVDFYSCYMGAIRQIDAEKNTYLWSVGGNYMTDMQDPPPWSMVEYTETGNGKIEYDLKFKYNEGTGRLYCANKCK